MVKLVLVEGIGLLAQKIRVLVRVIDLYGMDSGYFAQVGLDPFPLVTRGGRPVGLDVFIHGIVGIVTAKGRGYSDGLVVIEEHPSRESAIATRRNLPFRLSGRQKMRIIPEG